VNKPHTCGEGLAEHSVVPLRLADLMSALADNLELHAGALLDDEHARAEHAVYLTLLARARDIAVALGSLGDQMAGSRELPMGGHDIAKLSSPEAVGAFERYVQVTHDVMALLQRLDAQNEQMLAMMRGDQRSG
jgi:hypothetical protein